MTIHRETCGLCHHFYRCSALICSLDRDSLCDFSPSRFTPRVEAGNAIGPKSMPTVKAPRPAPDSAKEGQP